MFFAPHTLEILVKGKVSEDSNGNAVSALEEWKAVGKCRCDDASHITLYGANGTAYSPKFKIVADKSTMLSKGDRVRALRTDGSVRGQGIVDNPTVANYLNYHSVWLT